MMVILVVILYTLVIIAILDIIPCGELKDLDLVRREVSCLERFIIWM